MFPKLYNPYRWPSRSSGQPDLWIQILKGAHQNADAIQALLNLNTYEFKLSGIQVRHDGCAHKSA